MKVILLYLGACLILVLLLLFMKRRNDRLELEKPSPIVKEVEVYELRKGWHDAEAKNIYRLYSGELLIWGDGHETMNTSAEQGARLWHDSEGWRCIGGGDLAWAKRTAKHYGITVPTEVTE